MRVITGSAKGRKLLTPDGFDTRPTSELVKEAVFSIIQFEVEGSAVLDLYAGSGQMGIEALSRGARSCVFVDSARACRGVIGANLDNTGFAGIGKVMAMDVAAYLNSASGPFDIAFLDPPYHKGIFEKLFVPLSAIINENGAIICETDKSEALPDSAGKLGKYKEYRYGKTKITVYRNLD